MRVAFMGTPEFSVPVLHRLAAAGHEIGAVYCRAPGRAGRGRTPRPAPVHVAAESLGFRILTPSRLDTGGEARRFAALDADVAVVAAYGLILPASFLESVPAGCINVHPSLLPRWRGSAPINRAILAGDEVTGVSIMRIEEGLDSGPVLLRKEVPIQASDTADSLSRKLSRLGAELVCETLDRLGELTPSPQAGSGISYARKIDKAEAAIDWTLPAENVDRVIRGLSRFPGAWTETAGERLKLIMSELAPLPASTTSAPPGTVLDDEFTVACGRGAVRLLELQRSGRAPMSAAEFRRGFHLPPGTRMGR